MITPQDQFLTSQGPMKAWFDLAREMEHRDGVIDVSPYPMQPWLDVKEGGWAVVVHTNNQSDLADQLAAESARFAWDRRQDFWLSERVDSELAVQQADQADRGLIILSDTGDSVYGGAPGDSTCILRALVAHPPTGIALIPLIEPKAVQAAHSAGVGSQISQTFHESNAVVSSTLLSSRKIESSFQLNCRVAAISKGVTIQLPERGVCEIGRTALLEIGQIRLVVMELRSFAINHPVLYTHLGLDIGDAKMVVLKTASNFQFFAQWRSGLIRVDTPGATQSDLTAFNWSHLPRPIFPFDPSCEFLG